MTISQKIFTYHQKDPIKLECEIDLDLLFDTSRERDRFEQLWKPFLESNPHNLKSLKKPETGCIINPSS